MNDENPFKGVPTIEKIDEDVGTYFRELPHETGETIVTA